MTLVYAAENTAAKVGRYAISAREHLFRIRQIRTETAQETFSRVRMRNYIPKREKRNKQSFCETMERK